MPRGSGGHHLTRPLTGGQPPLTGGPVTAGKPRGTTQVVTRGYLMINCSFRWWLRCTVHPRLSVQGWGYEVRDSRVLEADMARCDWWIQLQITGGYELVIGSGIAGSDNISQERHHVIDGINGIITFLEHCIVKTDKVIHTVETDKVKQIVDVESSSKSADEIDKEIVSVGEMQLKQEDRSYVHASIKLYLHVVHVVLSENESDQH
ncbi:hypothetical protein Tco_1074719 [Tanacetum coccineum]